MLPKENRLRAKRLVAQVYQKGQRQQGEYLSLRRLPDRGGPARVAVVVSTAVSKKATERNRAKRVLRALLASITLPPGDLVLSVKRLPPHERLSPIFRKELSRWFPSLRSD